MDRHISDTNFDHGRIRRLAGLLGAIIAVVGFFYSGHKKKQKENLQELLNALRDSIGARYEYGLNPSYENERNYAKKTTELGRVKKRQGIKKLQKHLKKRGVLYIGHGYPHSENNIFSFYAAKIVDHRKVEGVNVYLTETETEDFIGVDTLEAIRDRRSFLGRFIDMDGRQAINIQVDSIKKDVREAQEKWGDYEENSSREGRGLSYDVEKQIVYDALYTTRNSEIAEKYYGMVIKGIIHHELKHIEDADRKLDRVNRETRAYLVELQHSPLVLRTFVQLLALDNPNPTDMQYLAVVKKISDGFMSFPDIHSKRDIYSLSSDEIGERARILFKRWYAPKGSG